MSPAQRFQWVLVALAVLLWFSIAVAYFTDDIGGGTTASERVADTIIEPLPIPAAIASPQTSAPDYATKAAPSAWLSTDQAHNAAAIAEAEQRTFAEQMEAR